MPLQLLPKSAAAFAPRAAPTIVLGAKVEPWLTHHLRKMSKVRRPLHSITQHHQRLTEFLGGDEALWNLCSLMLPKAPEKGLTKDDDNPLVEAISNYNLVHITAYVVHVDMVSEHEVAFKLTTESIDTLVDYHRDVYSVDAASNIYDWPEKDAQVKKLQDEFVQAANRFVFRTGVHALEGLEEGGSGELLEGRAEDVKRAIMNLFAPLLPPPPRVVDVIIPASSYLQPPAGAGWWPVPPTLPSSDISADHWHVLPSTPSPTVTQCSDTRTQFWSSVSLDPSMETAVQLPSPTPSGSLHDFSCDGSLYSTPDPLPIMPAYPLPTNMLQNCGSTLTIQDVDSMGWGFNSFATPQYAATM
ncbi:hypothetical protein K461DRAFT_228408 [Myriangium duriaei CBS 260.36]|uniref:Uncharacterized protein n=1 Tax=Myriangium duriaei CBS 260.36 TaxID=1168546 RepID=A0A9P4MEB3_9PEZI|nr:hypothetical protein K461DRAFT_228408 [Myriangium duriaei CBS 260.36]